MMFSIAVARDAPSAMVMAIMIIFDFCLNNAPLSILKNIWFS